MSRYRFIAGWDDEHLTLRRQGGSGGGGSGSRPLGRALNLPPNQGDEDGDDRHPKLPHNLSDESDDLNLSHNVSDESEDLNLPHNVSDESEDLYLPHNLSDEGEDLNLPWDLSEEDDGNNTPLSYNRLLTEPPVSRRPRIDPSYRIEAYPEAQTAAQRVTPSPPPTETLHQCCLHEQ